MAVVVLAPDRGNKHIKREAMVREGPSLGRTILMEVVGGGGGGSIIT